MELPLRSDGGPKLSSNQASSCSRAPIAPRRVLGQTGEADATPTEDRDTYIFAGKAGQEVEVALDRDGSTGRLSAVVRCAWAPRAAP